MNSSNSGPPAVRPLQFWMPTRRRAPGAEPPRRLAALFTALLAGCTKDTPNTDEEQTYGCNGGCSCEYASADVLLSAADYVRWQQGEGPPATPGGGCSTSTTTSIGGAEPSEKPCVDRPGELGMAALIGGDREHGGADRRVPGVCRLVRRGQGRPSLTHAALDCVLDRSVPPGLPSAGPGLRTGRGRPVRRGGFGRGRLPARRGPLLHTLLPISGRRVPEPGPAVPPILRHHAVPAG